MSTSYVVRRATEADGQAWWELSNEAFGGTNEPPETYPSPVAEGQRPWVLTAGEGGPVVGKARDRRYEAWFGGRTVRCCGVASVVVQTEARGGGAMRQMLTAMLQGARDEGAVISLLYPSAAGIYRSLGYELVGDFTRHTFPTADLARVTPDPAVRLRRATEADLPRVIEMYEAWAATRTCVLSHRGESFPDPAASLGEVTGVTLAEDENGLVGYCAWEREGSYHPEGKLLVWEFVAQTPGAARSLLAALGSSATVGQVCHWYGTAPEPARLLMPSSTWAETDHEPFMLGLLDVAGALEARGYGDGVEVDLSFVIRGMPLGGDGAYRLRVRHGSARCERIELEDDLPEWSARGLAVRYAAALPCQVLREVGLLSGPTGDDHAWDVVFGNAPIGLVDSF